MGSVATTGGGPPWINVWTLLRSQKLTLRKTRPCLETFYCCASDWSELAIGIGVKIVAGDKCLLNCHVLFGGKAGFKEAHHLSVVTGMSSHVYDRR